MKKFIFLFISCIVLISCSKSDSSPATPPNVAPTIPVLVSPANNKVCTDNPTAFQWNAATDANNDAINYQFQIAKDNQFLQILATFDATTNFLTITLDKSTGFFWRVKATDAKGLSSNYSEAFKFYTTGDAVVNHLPFSPELVLPALNGPVFAGTTTLTWSATDSDANDKLTFDVYFGTVNPPTAKVANNTIFTSVDVFTSPLETYYWKVVAKDNKGGATVGQVWKFTAF